PGRLPCRRASDPRRCPWRPVRARARGRGAAMTEMPATTVVSATRAEQPGASMRLGGLTVVERAIKQLAQVPDTRIIVASDGTIPLPARLPANVEVQTVKDADAAASIAA